MRIQQLNKIEPEGAKSVQKKNLVFILVAAFVLTACGQISEGIQVGDTKVSVSQIQKSIDEILKERKGVDTSQMQLLLGAELARSQAQLEVISLVVDQVAKDKQIQITNADLVGRKTEIEKRLADQGADLKSALVGAGLGSSNLDKYLKIILVSEKVSDQLKAAGTPDAQIESEVSKIIGQTSQTLKVKVNPRYGKWNSQTASIDAADNTLGAVVNR